MEALIRHKSELIHFPTDIRDVAQAIRRMETVAGLQNAVGAIDGFHVSIKAPQVNHKDYSINLQGVVDASGKFIDVRTGWPGVSMTLEFCD